MSAIPFLQPDENGHFSVNPKAAAILSKINTSIKVVTVAGPYRTGKSYLLNRLISQSGQGFSVGNTVNACTKGIWLWEAPVYDSKRKTTYVYLDTEGLNSTGEEVTFDTQIFALSVLLSSAFVLNTQNNITESALEQLELVAECSKSISFRPPTQEQQDFARELAQARERGEYVDIDDVSIDRELALHFPSLTWVLRDFGLLLKDRDGRDITPKEYLENNLKPIPENKRGAAEKNRIRRSITSCFLKRECVPLVRPVADESALQHLDGMPVSQLRPEFEQGIKHLRAMIAESDVKQVNGKVVNGPMLVGLAREYADAMNTGRMPSILSAWQSVMQVKIAEAAAAGLRVVLAAIEASCAKVTEEAAIREAHATALEQVAQRARNETAGDLEAVDKIREEVHASTLDALEAAVARNAERSEEYCHAVFRRIWEDNSNPCSKKNFLKVCEEGSVDDISEFVVKVGNTYDLKAVGPFKGAVRADISQKLLHLALGELHDRVGAAVTECDRLEQDLATARAEGEKATLIIEQERRRASELDKTVSEQRHKLALAEQRLAMSDKIASDLERRVEQQEASAETARAAANAAARRAADSDASLAAAQADVRRLQAGEERWHHEADSKTRLLEEARHAVSELKSTVSELKRDAAASERELRAAESESQRLRMDLDRETKAASTASGKESELTERLRQVNVEATQRVQVLEADARAAKKRADKAEAEVASIHERVAATDKLYKRAVSQAEADRADFEAQLDKYRKDAAQFVSRGDQETADLRKQIASLQSKVRDLADDGRAKDHALAELRHDQASTELRMDLDRARRNELELARELEALRKELAQREQLPSKSSRHSLDSMGSMGSVGNDSFASEGFMSANSTPARSRASKLQQALDSDSDESGWEEGGGVGASPMRVPDQEKIIARRRANGSAIGLPSHDHGRADANTNAPASNVSAKRKHERVVDPAFRAAAMESLGLSQAAPATTARQVPPGAESADRAPSSCTIAQLKSWLTSLDVDLNPNTKMKKKDYIDLLYKHDPRL